MKTKVEAKSPKSQAETIADSPARVGDSPISSTTLSREDLKILKSPFPKDSLGVKVQSISKDRNRAMLVLYLQHTDVQDRLEMVDPAWTSEVINEERLGDSVYVRIRMTLKGVSRENVGEGSDPKGAYSDALKRAAMLFGVGRYLYDSPTVWTEYNESRDRFRSWTIQDFEKSARGSYTTPTPEPSAAAEVEAETPGLTTQTTPKAAVQPKTETAAGKKTTRSREQLNRVLMNLYRPYLTKYPDTRFVELLQNRYNVGETRLMTIEQIEDLVSFMEQQLSSKIA